MNKFNQLFRKKIYFFKNSIYQIIKKMYFTIKWNKLRNLRKLLIANSTTSIKKSKNMILIKISLFRNINWNKLTFYTNKIVYFNHLTRVFFKLINSLKHNYSQVIRMNNYYSQAMSWKQIKATNNKSQFAKFNIWIASIIEKLIKKT